MGYHSDSAVSITMCLENKKDQDVHAEVLPHPFETLGKKGDLKQLLSTARSLSPKEDGCLRYNNSVVLQHPKIL